MKPVRVQLSRKRGWKMPENTVKVTRPGRWGNPFPIVKGTSTTMRQTTDIWIVGTWEGPAMWLRDTKAEATELSVAAFRLWIEQPAQEKLRCEAVTALRGKNLACWCRLDQPCHADVLLELANSPVSAQKEKAE
jgi:hypothetical protein